MSEDKKINESSKFHRTGLWKVVKGTNKKTRESVVIKVLNKPLIEKLGRHDSITRELEMYISMLRGNSGFTVEFIGYFAGVKEIFLVFEDFKSLVKPENIKRGNSVQNRRLISETALGLLEINKTNHSITSFDFTNIAQTFDGHYKLFNFYNLHQYGEQPQNIMGTSFLSPEIRNE
jgi:hypothetical protein